MVQVGRKKGPVRSALPSNLIGEVRAGTEKKAGNEKRETETFLLLPRVKIYLMEKPVGNFTEKVTHKKSITFFKEHFLKRQTNNSWVQVFLWSRLL